MNERDREKKEKSRFKEGRERERNKKVNMKSVFGSIYSSRIIVLKSKERISQTPKKWSPKPNQISGN